MSNSLFNNNFQINNWNNNSEKGIFSSNFQNVFNNKNNTSFNNRNLLFQKNNQLINNNQINSQNNNYSLSFNIGKKESNKDIFGRNISTNFSIFSNKNKNDNSKNSIFQLNNSLINQNSIFSSNNKYENTINWIYTSKEIYEMTEGKKEKSLLISFTVDNFNKGSFEEYRLADIEYQKTKKNELYKIVDKTKYGCSDYDSYKNSNSIFTNNIISNNKTVIFKDNYNMNELENNTKILTNQSSNLLNKNNAFINPPQNKNNEILNFQNNDSLRPLNFNNNTINSQNNNNLNSNNIYPIVFTSNGNNNKYINNNPINNLQNLSNNNNSLFNQTSLNYISNPEINKNVSLNNQNFLNNTLDISFQDNEYLNISESVENAILKKIDINCFIQEMNEKYSNKNKDNYYFGKFLQKKSQNINTSYIRIQTKNIEYYHKKYTNLYSTTTKKRYINNKNKVLSRSNSINSSFSQLSKNEIEKKYLTSIKKSKNEDYTFPNYNILKKKDKTSNKENNNNNNNLIFKQENKKRNIISFKVKINLPNNENYIINLDEININNKVIILKNQIQEKLENILNEKFQDEKIDKISILIPGTFLSDDEQLNSYNLTENIEGIIIYKEKENGGILIKKKKIAPIELIPKLSKNGYYTFPEYINLCRMSEDELRNIENFKIYNENGEIQFLEKINLLGANLDNEYIIEKNEIEIKKNLNVKKKCILYNLKFENYDENILKQFRERITEKNGEFVSYEPLNGRLEWYYVN